MNNASISHELPQVDYSENVKYILDNFGETKGSLGDQAKSMFGILKYNELNVKKASTLYFSFSISLCFFLSYYCRHHRQGRPPSKSHPINSYVGC